MTARANTVVEMWSDMDPILPIRSGPMVPRYVFFCCGVRCLGQYFGYIRLFLAFLSVLGGVEFCVELRGGW